ncbi:C39 family peptidase [Ectobacillus panaciterrae]|uniref:C39 family peptidase n=1 Tax=Ectobacillus panaciterrae TaxID=363872 RepID=UPI00041F2892
MLKKSKIFIPSLFLLVVAGGCSANIFEMMEEGKNKVVQTMQELRLDFFGELKEHAMIEQVPFIQQQPELDRGCEVTSLAMLLQYKGVKADKMTLAKEIERVPFEQNGLHGNPNEGFVGDIYTTGKSGYGVYHKPIFKLGQKYLPNELLDLTGRDIKDIYKAVSMGAPVWVITNATFEPLDESEFEMWHTNAGEVKITYQEHSVVIVGYDQNNVYVNDPLANSPKSAIPREGFEKAWEQMGKQAISLVPQS